MNLFELFVKIGVDDQASGKLGEIGGKLGNGLKTAAKIGTAAVGAAAAGITALTKSAVDNYAEYEQLVGGVETLFKSSSDTVVQYAQNAYKTAGLSANDYMNTVTSFSASLLQSLGGDTDAAAKKADVAITDMADNANKMGTSIEMLQTTYAGFAKQNFTMLDNLKLGYGGTKEEMQRLLDDASKISGIKYDISSFADITDAIHVMQEEMGIAGATALEAGTTIQGSIGAMKGAWTNLVTGIADDNADFEKLIDNFVTTIVGDGTESNLGVFGNILPRIETTLNGIIKLVDALAPKIIKEIPRLISSILPSLLSGAVSILNTLVQTIPELSSSLLTALVEQSDLIIQEVLNTLWIVGEELVNNAPILIDSAFKLIDSLLTWLIESAHNFIVIGSKFVITLAEGLLQPDRLALLIESALILIEEIYKGLTTAIPLLIEAATKIITGLVEYILEPDNLEMLLMAAVDVVVAFINGILTAIPKLVEATKEIISTIWDNITEVNWLELGGNILEGLWNGIKDKVEWLKSKVKGVVNTIKEAFTGSDGFDTHSPSKWSEKVFKNVMDGSGNGLDDGLPSLLRTATGVTDSVKNALTMGDYSVPVSISGSASVSQTTSGTMAELDSIRRDISLIASVLMNGITLDANDRELGRFVRKYATT